MSDTPANDDRATPEGPGTPVPGPEAPVTRREALGRSGATPDAAPVTGPAGPDRPAPLRVLLSGASGMIGTELGRQLRADGHEVLSLVRRAPQRAGEFHWSPSSRMLDSHVLDSVDAVVNLSGASISRLPWTRGYKKEILDSRIQATRTITDAMRMAANPPRVLLNASAVGYYGDRPGEQLTETSSRGRGFLADVVERWEQAAHLAPGDARVVTLRTGLVLGHGGALRPLLPLTRFGLSGPLGSGDQVWPWISLHDEAAAIRHLLTSTLAGPVNLAGPTPATANRLMKRLAERLHRPYRLAVPAAVIRLTLRDAGDELLLSSQQVAPEALLQDGFAFRHATVEEALEPVLRG